MEPFETFIWRRIFIQIGGIIAIAAFLGGFVLAYNATWNTVVYLDQQADERWSRLGGDMVERYRGIEGLIANLRPSLGTDVSISDGVAVNLIHWRTALAEGDIGTVATATTNLEASLSSLTVILQKYPEIRGSQDGQDFLATLEGTEQRLVADQSVYNEAVRRYNRAISSFPGDLWAGNWGFGPRDYFMAAIGSAGPPPLPAE